MQPILVSKPEILLVGLSFYGDPFTTSGSWSEANEIGHTWQRLGSYLDRPDKPIRHRLNPEVAYEVHIYGEETNSKGLFEVFVGVPVARLEEVPVELQVKILPATDYAVFTLGGQAITGDWGLPIQQWLNEAGYEYRYPYSAQCYDARFKGLDRIAELVLDVYIPVRPKTVA